MTSRWRLINGKELYDIKADPGQRLDVATGHPSVVQRLTKFYDAWWAELEPTFAQATAIYLGHPAENPARLTSHDWVTTGSTPWNQAHVRRALKGQGNTGYWNVDVVAAGDYEIRLRRWPEEADLPIDSPLAAGADVPGAKPFRATPGVRIQPTTASLRIGDVFARMEVKPGAKEVTFNLKLNAGKTRMTALFETAEGEEYGAYYTYVTKK